MARVTIEDCVPYVENRFKLVIVAAQLARQILAGTPLELTGEQRLKEGKADKADVAALRAIAAGVIDTKVVDEAIIKKYQKFQTFNEGEGVDSPDSAELSTDIPDSDSNESEQNNNNEIITNMYAAESCDADFEDMPTEDSSDK